jgi:lantibiotic leader peptide-processing serine protease
MRFNAPRIVVGLMALATVLSSCADANSPVTGLESTDAALNRAAEAGAGRYIILMKGEAVPGDLAGRVRAAGGRLVHVLPQVGIAIAETSGEGFAARMASDNRVQSIGPEPVAALPGGGGSLWEVGAEHPASLHAPTAADDLFNAGLVWGVERVKAPVAWARGHAYTGAGAVVGVIDTGIASNHPDLASNLVFNACFTSAGEVIGRDWQAGDPCNPYPSLSDHGTHVAGTVAARFGGGRVVGVAPNAQLANYNVFEFVPGFGVGAYPGSRWMAMIHAADTGVDAINMSLGSLTFIGNDPKRFAQFGLQHQPGRQDGLATFLAAEKRVANYVNRRGTVMVSSAGNAAVNLNGNIIATPGETQGHITVGATGIRPNPWYQPGISWDVRSFFSNYGAPIDVVAPGGDCGQDGACDSARPANWFEYLVLSTIVSPGVVCAQTQSCALGYGWKGGTSMAAPHVAGVVAIVRAVSPDLSAQQVNNRIIRTAERIGSRQEFGHGMVDAAAASAR